MNPTPGRIVMYVSKNGDGIESPAIVLRTRATTNLDIIERWSPTSPDGTLSGKERPAALVPELPDDTTVDLLVHGLGGDYREFCIPLAEGAWVNDGEFFEFPAGTWHWPTRV